jgi:hypothetical protein
MKETKNSAGQATGYEPKLVYSASEKELALASGQCGACQRRGFAVFLVRKSIIPSCFMPTINWDKGMVTLAGREPTTEWHSYRYAYRTLREGYVYILANPQGNQDDSQLVLQVYEVTHSGAFRLRDFRDVKGTRPKEIPVSCITAQHQVKAQFITIDNNRYDKAWLAYSSVRWTAETVDYYRQHADERQQRFSWIDLRQASSDRVRVDQRRFAFRDFLTKQRHLLELECDKHMVRDYFDEPNSLTGLSSTGLPLFGDMRRGMMDQQGRSLKELLMVSADVLTELFGHLFYTASHFNSLKGEDLHKALEQTVSRYKSDREYGGVEPAVLVVEDSLGIAEELSVQRRQQLAPVTEGLSEQSETGQQALSGYHRLICSSGHEFIYDKERSTNRTALVEAMQLKNGRDKLAEYYGDKAGRLSDAPLCYFAPEIIYARHHYRRIEQYKASIRGSVLESGADDAYLFLFYRKADSYDPTVSGQEQKITNDKFAHENNLINLRTNHYKRLNELAEIDKIRVIDVIGEETLAEKLGLSRDSAGLPHPYLYCRYLSEYGLVGYNANGIGLGDYKEVLLSAE